MSVIRRRYRSVREGTAPLRPRRGMALVFVLVFVVAMASLAMASIFMTSNATLLAKSYDRERDLKFAADAALSMGKARVNVDQNFLPSIPVGQLYRQLFSAPTTITGANGMVTPGITVQTYIGPTGSINGQNGRFASIVAVATDQRGSRFIRRLELTQESFAKFAYWSNSESNNGNTIFFNNGDQLFGPVWSNDQISIGSGGATFRNSVGTAMTVAGKNYGNFSTPPLENQKPIALPSTASLTKLPTYASGAGWSFKSGDGATSNESAVRDRIEFVAIDTDSPADKDSVGDREGFFRVYNGNANTETSVRGDWPGSYNSIPSPSATKFCGDWHYMAKRNASDTLMKFYPVSVHNTPWFRPQVEAGYVDRGVANAHALAVADSAEGLSVGKVLANPKARCYLAGDPHLIAVDRVVGVTASLNVYLPADVNRGGEDTTFTPVGRYGSWRPVTQTSATAPIVALRPWDGQYLNGISTLYTPGAKGVIYFDGNVGVSGTVNGLVTLYTAGTIVILDDIRYANDPVTGRCHDILGLLSAQDVVVADNALNTPPYVRNNIAPTNLPMDDTKDIFIHSVIMALNTSFRVENFDQGPTAVNNCDLNTNGRGCIYLSGGLIQNARGAVGTGSGTGYSKRYTYDHCAVVNPPPYFPTTGRFQDNRYIELDPAGFDPKAYFLSITPDP